MNSTPQSKPRRIYVIVNPAAGKPRPVLHVLHAVFEEAGVEWDVAVTHQPGDARALAAKAAAKRVDVVAVYGGDDTVLDVAAGLLGTRVPMAILPGGASNTRAKEFGVPLRLDAAARIACDPTSRVLPFDMGQCNGSFFMRHVQIGLSVEQLTTANAAGTDKKRMFAHAFATLKAMHDTKPVRFRLIVDGQPIECVGVLCHIANTQAAGEMGHVLAPEATASDGLLDVVVVRATDFDSLTSGLTGGQTAVSATPGLRNWRGRVVDVTTSRPLPAQCDGAPCGSTPLHVEVVRQGVKILVRR